MAFTPPNTFVDGNTLSAGALKGNDDALKVYLHEGVVSGDLKASSWVDTRHIQAPILDALTGVQHGVTGFQGSQWAGGVLVQAQFGTALLTGKRYGSSTADDCFEIIPQTSFGLSLRKASTVLFHWWMESVNGPDTGARNQGAGAYMWVTEYNASGLLAGTGIKSLVSSYTQEVVNNHLGFSGAGNPPGGPQYPYSLLGYGNMSGTTVFTTTTDLCVGLAHLSTIDRSAIINWGIALEVYY